MTLMLRGECGEILAMKLWEFDGFANVGNQGDEGALETRYGTE